MIGRLHNANGMCHNVCMGVTPQYIAGLIDSDGSISIVRRSCKNTSRGYNHREMVQITWKHSIIAEQVFNELKNMFGGSVFVHERKSGFATRHTTLVKYTVEGKGAEAMMIAILPYLTIKQQQASYLLQMRGIKKTRYGFGREKPNHIWDEEDVIYEAMQKQRSRSDARAHTPQQPY